MSSLEDLEVFAEDLLKRAHELPRVTIATLR
jgi:hypothetical protein